MNHAHKNFMSTKPKSKKADSAPAFPMIEIKDSRFSKVHSDPHYMRQPKRDRKVPLDPRFKGMMTDSRFGSDAKFDKHGKK